MVLQWPIDGTSAQVSEIILMRTEVECLLKGGEGKASEVRSFQESLFKLRENLLAAQITKQKTRQGSLLRLGNHTPP